MDLVAVCFGAEGEELAARFGSSREICFFVPLWFWQGKDRLQYGTLITLHSIGVNSLPEHSI